MNWKKILSISPFLIIGIIISSTWMNILLYDEPYSWKIIVGVTIFVINFILYFLRFNWGIVFTGVYLLCIIFGAAAITYEIHYESWGIGIGNINLSTPKMDVRFLLLFGYYIIINYNILKSTFILKKPISE